MSSTEKTISDGYVPVSHGHGVEGLETAGEG